MKSDQQKRILIFNPYSGINYFSKVLFLLANKLKEQGAEVSYLGCHGVLKKYCITFSAYGLKDSATLEQKQEVCRRCQADFGKLTQTDVFSNILTVDQYVTKEMLASTEEVISQCRELRIEDMWMDDYPIGRMASYEFILNNKIIDIDKITKDEFEVFISTYLYNVILIKKIIDAIALSNQFDMITMYNSMYGQSNMAFTVFKKHNFKSNFIHGGFNLAISYESLYFSSLTPSRWNLDCLKYYEENNSNLNISYEYYKYPLLHIKSILSASSIHTYSEKKQEVVSDKILSFQKNFKKNILLSLSSADEAYAADFAVESGNYISRSFSLFEDRIEWLKSMVTFFSKYKDVGVIIRLHPREFANKREDVVGKHVKVLTALLENLPPNFYINLPTDKVSIYDLFKTIDLHLCSQTTVGLESSIFGIQTMSYIKGIGNYPTGTITKFEHTKEKYFEAIDNILTGKVEFNSLVPIEQSMKWLIYLHKYLTYNFKSDYMIPGKNRIIRRIKVIADKFRNPYTAFYKNVEFTKTEDMKLHEFFQLENELTGQSELALPRDEQKNAVYLKHYIVELIELWSQTPISRPYLDCAIFIKKNDMQGAHIVTRLKSGQEETIFRIEKNDKVLSNLIQALKDL